MSGDYRTFGIPNAKIKAMKPMLSLLLLASFPALVFPQAPAPFGAVPSERQLAWHALDYYAFVHFNINTFSDKEWGHGDEPAALFNPTELDCRQWARVCKEAGMKGIIITAKHHDGFCLWPSKYTEHSVRNSPWKNGKGDVLRDLSDACKEYGLKMGVYLSPWDRNNPLYGTPEYNAYFTKQLEEVLTGYGDIFEVWFDGAVSEEFKGKQIYDWPAFIATVRKHQPNAVIFSDAGPDIRWVGTERGFANPTNWATLNRDEFFPGTPRYLELRSGHKNGTHWLPAEVDVSIRPGWYYHKTEDDRVKSGEHLERIYYHSVGRNANLLLNLPVDRRGLVHENDVQGLQDLRRRLDATFSTDHARGATVKASSTRAKAFSPGFLTDGDNATYWAAEDGAREATLELTLPAPAAFNVVELREFLPLGQRADSVSIEVFLKGRWTTLGRASTIGNRRLVPIPRTTTQKLRIRIWALACPTLSGISLYNRPHENYLLESNTELDERMTWWRNAGFGMFIHWGAYAVPAGVHQGTDVPGAAEWLMSTARVPVRDYEPYTHQFNPTRFDAAEWSRTAKAAGMNYVVITSKHHDGFCIWDSNVSTYDIMDAAPFRRDILKELSDACKAEGIALGFYHSIMDWHHPDAQGKDYGNGNPAGADFASYRDTYLKPQLKELIEKYDPAILWFDGEWIPEWTEEQGKALYQYVRSLKPDILVNNRVGKGRQGMQGMNAEPDDVGDFGTPEQEVLATGSSAIDWESCMTMNDSWGFKIHDENWKSAETLIHHLADIAAKGGNYLLNVGPTAEGLIPAPSVERLKEMGDWLRINGEAVYRTRMWQTFQEGESIRYTAKAGNQVYAIALSWPGSSLTLKSVRPVKGSKIYLLGYSKPLSWTFHPRNGLDIRIPDELQDPSARPCAQAWAFSIQGTPAGVSPAPQILRMGKKANELEVFGESAEAVLQSTNPQAKIYYTLDGSTPTESAAAYAGPIRITETCRLQAIAAEPGKVSSPAQTVFFQKSRFNHLALLHPYAEKYNGGGPLGLVDGRKGSTTFSDGRWQGFEGTDFQATIDLGKIQPIRRIQASFLRDIGSWIFPPVWVRMEVSEDGTTYQIVKQFDLPDPKNGDPAQVLPFEALGNTSARYIRVTAKNLGKCPSWHAGSGGKAWVFADEISVE